MNAARTERRRSSASAHGETDKFPDFEQSMSLDNLDPHPEKDESSKSISRLPSPRALPKQNGNLYSDNWQHKKDHHVVWGNGHIRGASRGHGRQPSLTEAIRTIRTRKGSVSANAQEIAEALKAPVSVKLIVCSMEHLL